MSDSLSLGGTVVGSEAIQKALRDFPLKVRARLRKKMDSLASRLASDVLSGMSGALQNDSGTLRAGLFKSARSSGTAVTMRVGIRSDVFYAPWLEFGTVPRDVRQRSGLLRKGKTRGEGVRHGWHLRPHPFLFPAWQALAPEADSEINQAVNEVAEEFDRGA